MQTCRCSFGPRITAIVRTRVIVPTTAFPSADRNQNTPFGHTKNLTRQSPTLKNTWRFIPRGSMQSSDLRSMKVIEMPKTTPEQNKALVLEAFVTLFNNRDYAAAERFWSPDYIQHSDHIAPGRDGLFNLIKSLPPKLKYEPGAIVAEGDIVIVHGRFSGFGAPVNWIAADIVRIQNGILAEHWDVIQDEKTEEQSISKRPMFGTTFPTYA